MNNQINDGGPAFPCPPSQQSNGFYSNGNGMTLREYAAIKLRVPDSGVPWLDEMITKANRDYFAAAALIGVHANPEVNKRWSDSEYAEFCYLQADAMLKAREVKP